MCFCFYMTTSMHWGGEVKQLWSESASSDTCGYRQLKWVSSIGWLGSHLRWGAWTSKGELGERAAVPLCWKESLGSGFSVSGISLVCLLGTSLWWSSKHIQLGGDTRVDPEHTGGTTYCISSNMGMALDFPGGAGKHSWVLGQQGYPAQPAATATWPHRRERLLIDGLVGSQDR